MEPQYDGQVSLPCVHLFVFFTTLHRSKSSDYHFMERVLKDLTGRSQVWPFLKPVNLSEVPDYYDFVKNPMGTFRVLSDQSVLLKCCQTLKLWATK